MNRLCLYILLSVIAALLSACSIQKEETEKLRDTAFTVVDSEEVPEELDRKIQEAKEDDFWLTYGNQGYLYAARGYGKQDTSGYSVKVTACFETANTIRVETELLGPPKGEETVRKKTCPYVVIKMEYSDKEIVFY